MLWCLPRSHASGRKDEFFFFFQRDGGEVAELRVSGVCFWICLFFSKQHMGVQTRTFIRLLIVKVTRIGHLSEAQFLLSWKKRSTEYECVFFCFVCVCVCSPVSCLSAPFFDPNKRWVFSVSGANVFAAFANVTSTGWPCHFTSGGEPTSALISHFKGSETQADRAITIHHASVK